MGPSLTVSPALGSSGNILGEEREVSLFSEFGSVTAAFNGSATAPDGPNDASFIGLDSDVDGLATLSLTYDGVGTAGLGGSDFAAIYDLLRVNLPVVTGMLDIRLTVIDTEDDMGTAAIGAVTTGGFYDFSFDDANFTNGNVDFSSVDSVMFEFETVDPGTEFTLSNITREMIPEPSAALLAVVGVFGLTLRRNRKS